MKKLLFPLLLGLCIFVGCEKKPKSYASSSETSAASSPTPPEPADSSEIATASGETHPQDESEGAIATSGIHEEVHIEDHKA